MSKDGLTGGAIFDIIKEDKNSPAAPGVIAVPHGYQFTIMAAPIFGDNYRYAFDKTRHKIIYMDKVDRDIVLADTFASIGSL